MHGVQWYLVCDLTSQDLAMSDHQLQLLATGCGTKTSLESLVGLEPNLNFYDISDKQKEMYRDIISTESAPRKMNLNPSHVPGLSPMVELCLAESSSMCSATHAGGQAQPLVVLKLACNRVFCQVHKSFFGVVFLMNLIRVNVFLLLPLKSILRIQWILPQPLRLHCDLWRGTVWVFPVQALHF